MIATEKTIISIAGSASEAIIIADVNTPYRLLTEVLFTLGSTTFAKFHLMAMQGKKQ